MMGAAGSSSAKVERMTPPKTARQSLSLPSSATPLDCYKALQPLSLFLTKVEGIPKEHNSLGALNLRGNTLTSLHPFTVLALTL